jgi:nitrogen regulation protein NR(I)
MNKILVVDDQAGICHSFKKILGRHGYTVSTALSGAEAIEKVGTENPALVFMDVTMPEMDGLETLQRLRVLYPDLTVIMMTAYSTTDKAINAMKYGAHDFITKPFDNAELLALVEKAFLAGNREAPVTFDEASATEEERIIGSSPHMLEIYKKIGQIAESDVTVLLRGETGTGKEKIARAVYQHSKRVDKPFLPVNCAAIPESLLEGELFGFEKGTFTGADARRTGKFEQCDTGTMFLDEIGDMPLPLQSKVLRVLQDGSFQRLGGSELITTDVRIITATNKDLEALTRQGKFREDLYWRLNVVSIEVPPLRQRKDDIEDLTRYFIQRFSRELGKDIKGVAPELLRAFKEYSWPGNVRELQSIIQRGVVLSKKDCLSFNDCELSGTITLAESRDDIDKPLSYAADMLLGKGGPEIYKNAVNTFEGLLVKKALEITGNNQALAARLLGISRNTLRGKLGRAKDKITPKD